MLNMNKGRVKQSRVERIMNQLIIVILLVQLIFCAVLGSLAAIWQNNNSDKHKYLDYDREPGIVFILNFFSYFLLLNTLIPISLIVTLEVVKFVQLFFMQWDVFMYHNGYYAKVSTCSINEELGQVKFIFSDKTGTLTSNQMLLKSIRIFDQEYGEPMLFKGKKETLERPEDNGFSFYDRILSSILHDQIVHPNPSQERYFLSTKNGEKYNLSTDRDRAIEFLKLLACCHDVSSVQIKGIPLMEYSGPSPDDVCLVDAAQRIYIGFHDNRNKQLTLRFGDWENRKEVELIESFGFTSDRARMSVLVRDQGIVELYCKGSDEKLIELLKKTKAEQQLDPVLKETNEYLFVASEKGLRTLYLAMKVLDNAEFEDWKKRYDKENQKMASSDDEKQQKTAALSVLINEIEKGLTYLGCTVVEDKLQENVENTIHNLAKAGIQVWMITGDKMGTARSIGYSCKMFTPDMEIIKIDEEYCNSTNKMLKEEDLLQLFSSKTARDMGLLITGSLVDKLVNCPRTSNEFVQFAQRCQAVVCCRTTASQKATVVRAMKEANPTEITLSIGDGGNDVPMINEAHVGVGIYGKEGMQAAQSGDYAIGEFQCLWNLLMIHGRLAYLRIAEMILYFFYKNAVFTLPQFYFAFLSGFSGQTIYDSWYISMYNLFFTCFPLLFKALLEHDVHHIQDRRLPLNKIFPKLYYVGQSNQIFNTKKDCIMVFLWNCSLSGGLLGALPSLFEWDHF
eukprot:TRINITY_DN6024_c0_g1_i3.p1 TRINITY_DN6024_c0_g1~~TRINITY_DN6024_c0_g1_i3.p1  ORF type:complete len:735 (-),score=91.35 TRINITY_DN6024_c0_g1_i3:486-2690(-)